MFATTTRILTAVVLWCLLWVSPLAQAEQGKCRCIPSQPCWPTPSQWQNFNSSLNGKLIRNHPVAAPCYPGPLQSTAECANIAAHATNNTFLQQFPVGYSYPLAIDCPIVNASAGQHPTGQCTLGEAPIYTINATCIEDIQKGIAFARERGLRLVVKDTGHDLLGRSEGKDGLMVWIKYLRTGLKWYESWKGEEWTGAAVTIGGGYVWSDVYPEAAKRGLIVVGGGTPSVGCIGGWMQGGGHSPATHDYGLGADQVLQARVVLANGSLVTASPTQNQDLFFAIRGGGPGTYGVVVETTVKAYPTTGVVAQTLAFAPLSSNEKDVDIFFTALADLYQAFPDLAKADWSGFGSWCTDCPAPLFGNFTTAYTHSLANFKKSKDEAEEAFAPLLAKLKAYNGTSLIVNVQYAQTSSYADYYARFSGVEPPAGTLGVTSGRFLDEKALTNRSGLMQTLRVVAGESGQKTSNTVEFFGAPYGAIAVDGDPNKTRPISGVNPAWRSMILNHIVSRGYTESTPEKEVEQIQHDVEFVKEAALKKLAPDTGTYMNEANRLDPEWKEDFYGTHYGRLERIKREVDPEGVFYCPTCVGSDMWEEKPGGQLCRVSK